MRGETTASYWFGRNNERIVRRVERVEIGELSHFPRQFGDHVVRHVKLGERGELTDLGRQV